VHTLHSIDCNGKTSTEEDGHGSLESNIPTFISSVQGLKKKHTYTHIVRELGNPVKI